MPGDATLTPRANKARTLAAVEARGLGHQFIGTEHLLLGLVREGEGIAAGVLGATLLEDRTAAPRVLAAGAAEPTAAKGNVITCRIDGRDLEARGAYSCGECQQRLKAIK